MAIDLPDTVQVGCRYVMVLAFTVSRSVYDGSRRQTRVAVTVASPSHHS